MPIKKKIIVKKKKGIIRPKVGLKKKPEKKATKAQVQNLVNQISDYLKEGYEIDNYQFRKNYIVYDSKKKSNVKKTLSQMTKPQMKQLSYKQLQTIQQAMRDVERKHTDTYTSKVFLIHKLYKKLKKLDVKWNSNTLTEKDKDTIKSWYKKYNSMLLHYKIKNQDKPTEKEKKIARKILNRLYIEVKTS